MILRICYFFIYIIESLISFYYFEGKYNRRAKKSTLFVTYFACFFTCFLVSSLQSLIINTTFFIISNMIISYFCYEANIKSCVFSNLILVAMMFSTELLVLLVPSLTQTSSTIVIPFNDELKFIAQALLSKLFFFFAVYMVRKISGKESKNDKDSFSLPLSILPLSAAIVVYTIFYLCLYHEIARNIQLAFEIGGILLIISTILVYYVHEVTRRINKKYTQLLLEQQHNKNYLEYYELLKEQNETSRILIHDVTKHLNAIKNFSVNDNTKLDNYIDSVVSDFSNQSPINYCKNPLVSLITYRYLQMCKKDNISMFVDIRSSKIDFMEDPDITSLFDNLLENALEAAAKTNEKQIDFSMHVRNKNYLIVKLANSCNNKPLLKDNNLMSTKETGLHGFGTRSIKRVVAKYDGDIRLSYEEESKFFTVTIILPIPENSQSVNNKKTE